ncbi:MAG: TadE/TadG family type IV pilus assembly protein [Hyphomicrobium sp.]
MKWISKGLCVGMLEISRSRHATASDGQFKPMVRVGFLAGVSRAWPGVLARLLRDDRASIAVKFAMTMPVMLAMVGGAMDYGLLSRDKARLQSAADAAAKAAALEFTMIDVSKHDVTTLTQGIVMGMIRANSDAEAASSIRVIARAQTTPLGVTVDATQVFKGAFGLFDSKIPPITVRSVARIVGKPNICVLALDREADGTIELWTKARLTAQNCAVYSNSSSPSGIKSKNNAMLSATMTCSVGGRDGVKGNFSPEPITDCPVFDDPLASRPAPSIGGCTATNTKLVSVSQTLTPGVYCGGIEISGSSQVVLDPGVYIIKDGPLLVTDSAALSGEGVGFYLTGSGARFQFDGNTTISLAAPESGQLAGLLFFEARDQVGTITHEINSDNARKLLGTIYLPVGGLKIDAKKPIADQSAYTAIVARTLRLNSGPDLVLNTNYHLSTVPVPEGIRGVGQPVVLVE